MSKLVSILHGKIIQMQVVAMLVCIATVCLFTSCHRNDESKENIVDESLADSRTVLFYMVAENSLWSYATSEHVESYNDSCDVTEIISGIRKSHLKKGDKVVVYLDDIEKPRIFALDRNVKGIKFHDLTPEYVYNEDVNSSSANQFSKVMDYVQAKYPASSYGIVFWSHGSGWIPSTYSKDYTANRRRSFGIDNGYNSASNVGNQMSITDMAKVIEEKGGVDFVFFDACFMQTIELCYELRRATKYVIGSPAEIPGLGADYRNVIPAMFKNEDYARHIVDAYYEAYRDNSNYGVIISAVDASRLDDFASYMRTVVANNAPRLFNVANYATFNYFNYERYRKKEPYYNKPDFYDIKGIMLNALDADDFTRWEEEFGKVVVKNCFTSTWYSMYPDLNLSVDAAQCGGVSMFLPLVDRYASDGFVEQSQEMQWGRDVWGDITSLTVADD